ncbi:hypothetical protein NVV99_13715 [Rhodococcus sp. PAE-6]|uniref:hypothetical protein n=1 Tax=Rhodococcus sp. PAE-6 TaxID=2972477 RepID=UPI0021B42357|nr:hypothetical protein [Rhodococcus sp. PAE-6]MCT7291998.1 hypothetical protein [Rhodococcus sp. PAE-6]
MNNDLNIPVDLCENLKAIERELGQLYLKYASLTPDNLAIDDLGEPMNAADARARVCGRLIYACITLKDAAEDACRLRPR